ncbi:reverse transcriptase domain-containing protein [Bdellovibrio bacteriovorus]|uniref:reverse transcriptase domain-containing protein n=1 Tax=Bdellovibrio bacteriovorus TaxID=959 RepID=UPI0035A710FB
MTLEEQLLECLEEECKKLMLRFHGYHNYLHINIERKKKRTATALEKIVKIPSHWHKDPKFNPFYVYKRRRQIARSIALKIESGEYKPNEPFQKKIPKPLGGKRTVAIYQIPDAAVSKFLYKKLLSKNKHRFSSFSYAYRNDRNVHFAIQDIAVELRQKSRLFIAEFDFSKFFESISHEYLFTQFSENSFLITENEKILIRAFLQGERGVPQGTSISLFLANLVCWSLDKSLERAGLQFARYADDTVIWSSDYQKINRAFDIMFQFSKDASVKINLKKSDGISILCHKDMPVEISHRKEVVDFLGYSISVDKVSIRDRSVNRIKREISYILYSTLIKPLLEPRPYRAFMPNGKKDPALLSAISEIRRFLYGNLSEEMISRFLAGNSKRIHFKGIMSFYPLLTDTVQLAELDGWLVNAIHKAVRLRGKILKKGWYIPFIRFPFYVRESDIVDEYQRQRVGGKRLLKVPSFRVIHKAIQKGIVEQGVEDVMSKKSVLYDYD